MELLNDLAFREKVYDYQLGGQVAYRGLIPAIVIFYASGAYCDIMLNACASLEPLYAGKLYFYSVDVNTDSGLELAKQFGIAAIPTSILIPTGLDPMIVTGLVPTDVQMEKMLTQLLSSGTMPGMQKKKGGIILT